MTKTQLATFKKYIQKWRDKFGLTDWYLSVQMSNADDSGYMIKPGNVCETFYDVQNRWAEVHIDEGISNATDRTLEATAKHEIIELSLVDIRESLCLYLNQDVVDKMIHRIIRRIENVLK